MMKKKFEIQNLKCEGCENTILKYLRNINGVKNVSLDITKSEVEFTTDSESSFEKVRLRLSQMGYPLLGDRNTLTIRAISYVSCAIGKINK